MIEEESLNRSNLDGYFITNMMVRETLLRLSQVSVLIQFMSKVVKLVNTISLNC